MASLASAIAEHLKETGTRATPAAPVAPGRVTCEMSKMVGGRASRTWTLEHTGDGGFELPEGEALTAAGDYVVQATYSEGRASVRAALRGTDDGSLADETSLPPQPLLRFSVRAGE